MNPYGFVVIAALVLYVLLNTLNLVAVFAIPILLVCLPLALWRLWRVAGDLRGPGTSVVDPWGAKGEPLSLVLSAELQPGLYKLRLWVACTDLPTARDGDSVQVEVLVKRSGEMNFRSVTGEDMLHRR